MWFSLFEASQKKIPLRTLGGARQYSENNPFFVLWKSFFGPLNMLLIIARYKKTQISCKRRMCDYLSMCGRCCVLQQSAREITERVLKQSISASSTDKSAQQENNLSTSSLFRWIWDTRRCRESHPDLIRKHNELRLFTQVCVQQSTPLCSLTDTFPNPPTCLVNTTPGRRHGPINPSHHLM